MTKWVLKSGINSTAGMRRRFCFSILYGVTRVLVTKSRDSSSKGMPFHLPLAACAGSSSYCPFLHWHCSLPEQRMSHNERGPWKRWATGSATKLLHDLPFLMPCALPSSSVVNWKSVNWLGQGAVACFRFVQGFLMHGYAILDHEPEAEPQRKY